MVTATFRFHAELNDFLPRERRGQAFSCPCARAATTKHMIEALGVPHTEVRMIMVNGEESGLDRLLVDGDYVEAYPGHSMLAVHPSAQSGAQPPRFMRFVADAHLGGLARLLRMAGFDTLYDNNFQDSEIEDISLRDNRIVLTRDRELLKRRQINEGCYIRALKSTEQLREVFERLDLAHSARPFTLCLHCNAPLRTIDKALVLERIPPAVRRYQEEFSTCDVCLRIFWQGSHWQHMQTLMQEMLARG
jgi:hypothetical protein